MRAGTRAWWDWWPAASRIASAGRWSPSRRRGDGPGPDDELRGSARSIAGVHVRDVLESVSSRHPGLIAALRRPCDGGGSHDPRGGPGPVRARLRCRGGRRNWRTGRTRRRDLDRWRAGREPRSAWPRPSCCVTPGPWGQAFPEPSFQGEFEVEIGARGGREAREVLAAAGRDRARASMPLPSTCWMASASRRRPQGRLQGWPTGSTSTTGRASGACSCWSSTWKTPYNRAAPCKMPAPRSQQIIAMPVETGLIKKNLRDLAERASLATGVSLTTTPRRSVSRRSVGELELPDVWNKPERAQELGRERARLSADLEQLDAAGSALANASELLELAEAEDDAATIADIEKEFPQLESQRARAGIPPHVPRRDGFAQRLSGYPGRRRRHRGAGLGADADAHVPALGRQRAASRPR